MAASLTASPREDVGQLLTAAAADQVVKIGHDSLRRNLADAGEQLPARIEGRRRVAAR
jgi:hypothetical protein